MRILKLTTCYSDYLDALYRRVPGLADQPYEKQKAALDHDAFGWADFWSHALAPLGYETWEVSANVEPLQRAWARAEALEEVGDDWLHAIALAQVRAFQPEILFLDDYFTFDRAWVEAAKAAAPGIRLTISWCGAPFQDADVFKAHDLVLSCIPELVERFRAMGHRSEHVHHAFEPRVLERIAPERAPDVEFSFVGSIVRTNRYHLAREHMLLELTKALPITLYTPQHGAGWRDDLTSISKRGLFEALQGARRLGLPEARLAALPVVGKAMRWPGAPRRVMHPQLRPFTRPPVFGLAMYETLRRSAATFNSHIDLSASSASNMRLFEATGAGTCLVTDWKPNLPEIFEVDREIVTYRSVEECIEKVRYLLAQPAEREAIARAGQARTLKEHTFAHRAERLDALIRQALR